MVYRLVGFVCLKPPILNTRFPCSKSWVFSDFLGVLSTPCIWSAPRGVFEPCWYIFLVNIKKRSTDIEYKGQVKIFDAGTPHGYTIGVPPYLRLFYIYFFHILMGRGVALCLIRFKILYRCGIKQNIQDEALFSPILAFSVFLCIIYHLRKFQGLKSLHLGLPLRS